MHNSWQRFFCAPAPYTYIIYTMEASVGSFEILTPKTRRKTRQYEANTCA